MSSNVSIFFFFADTQEAPKSLSIDSSSSLESLASDDNDLSHSDNELGTMRPQKQPPPLLPGGGAFANYARRRGEPDGRTASATDGIGAITARKPPMRPGGGGESDAAFTPSPPVVLQPPDAHAHGVALSLAHQTRIRSMYTARRPDSSSSASSATDWDNGHATVLRRHLPPLPPPPPRGQPGGLYASAFDNSSDSDLDAKLFAAAHKHHKTAFKKPPLRAAIARKIDPPADVASFFSTPDHDEALDDLGKAMEAPVKSDEAAASGLDVKPPAGPAPATAGSIHDTILATQLRHINREMTPTISEVYHERNIGLGLAPPLSKLLLSPAQGSQPPGDDSLLDKIKNSLGILDDADLDAKECARCAKAECTCRTKPWLTESTSALQTIHSSDLTTADILEREANKLKKLEETKEEPFPDLTRRDEGDGRSIADSQCSSSYSKRAGAAAVASTSTPKAYPEKARIRAGIAARTRTGQT